MKRPASLFVVATPLGNLGDLTLRARDVLREVPVVAAEDTRRTRQLLHHIDAHPRLLSLHAHSPEARMNEVLALLAEGKDVALVTDAGTPAVSDPGPPLVQRARDQGYAVVPVPGPSAVAAALSVAGMAADQFLFLGFIARKGKERTAALQRAAREPWPVVFFEAANRLVALLEDLAAAAGPGRPAVVGRELTKLHEDIRAGTLAELATYYRAHAPRGEVTLVISGEREARVETPVDLAARARELLGSGMKPSEAVRHLVKESGESRNRVYEIVMEVRGEK